MQYLFSRGDRRNAGVCFKLNAILLLQGVGSTVPGLPSG